MKSRATALVLGSALVTCGGLALARLRKRWIHVTVDGPSMLPTLAAGDRVLARRVPPASITAGDIVLVQRPTGDAWIGVSPAGPPQPPPGRWMIKRAVAVPGDRVPPASVAERDIPVGEIVPDGMFVLLGDNRADSVDSRLLGYCPATSVVGVVAHGHTGPP